MQWGWERYTNAIQAYLGFCNSTRQGAVYAVFTVVKNSAA